jgi:hypothetical protein
MASTVTAYTSFYPLLVPELPGIENVLMLQQIQLTAREFFRDTESWREELSPVNIVVDKTTYALPKLYDAMIHRIIWVKTGGDTADPIEVDDYNLIEDYMLELENAPDTALTDGLIVKAVFIPYLFSNEIPTFLMEKWAEAIAAGVKAALMMQNNKKWSNAERGQLYAQEFYNWQARARFDNVHKNKVGVATVGFNDWI